MAAWKPWRLNFNVTHSAGCKLTATLTGKSHLWLWEHEVGYSISHCILSFQPEEQQSLAGSVGNTEWKVCLLEDGWRPLQTVELDGNWQQQLQINTNADVLESADQVCKVKMKIQRSGAQRITPLQPWSRQCSKGHSTSKKGESMSLTPPTVSKKTEFEHKWHNNHTGERWAWEGKG